MKVKPLAVFEALSGKVCEHSDMSVSLNKKTGKMYTTKRCYPSDKAPSEAQLAQRQAFKAQRAKAAAIVADSAQWATYQSAYDAQSKYSSKIGFIMHKIKMGDISMD